VDGSGPAFGARVDVDCEKGFRCVRGQEGGDEGFPGVNEGGVEGVNSAGIQGKCGTREDFDGGGCVSGGAGREREDGGVVEVCDADVTAALAAVEFIDGWDFKEAVGDAREGEDSD